MAEKPESLFAADVERLSQAIGSLYASQAKAAADLGWSQSTINRTLDPERAIQKNVLLLKNDLLEKKNISRDWLDTGRGEMLMSGQGDGDSGRLPEAGTRENPQEEGEMPAEARRHAALLTVYDLDDVGNDADAARSVVVADRREVQQHTRTHPEHVRRRYMRGDYMRATIIPNAQCYCVPVERFEGHGIYYFTVDDQPFIARLQALGGGAWLIKYDNDSYDDELLLPDDDAPAADAYVSELTGRTVRLCILERVRSFIVES